MNHTKLFHRDFTLMVLGQIASLFGNSILRFALSLYVLDKTGSAAAFGSILAISMIPTILLSPVGGMIADRVNRRNIMVALDFTTAALIGCFTVVFHSSDKLLYIGIMMVLLAVIQSCYQPSVQSSIPALAGDEHLMRANGVVIQVNALSGLLGPIIGGFLYGIFGITPILIASTACFFLSAVMELFLRIPFIRQERTGGLFAQSKQDIADAFRFVSKEKPVMLKLMLILAFLNLFLSAMVIVGLPYMIKIFLGLSSQLYGFAEGALAVGTILGGCLVGVVSKKIKLQKSYLFLLFGSIALIPLGFAVTVNSAPMVSYGVILVSVMVCLCFAAMFNIYIQTFAQRQTPVQLLGKVSSVITTVVMCMTPLGQAMYGIAFDWMQDRIFVVVFFACIASVLITVAVAKILKQVKE